MVHTTGGSESVKKNDGGKRPQARFFFPHHSRLSEIPSPIVNQKRVVASTGCFAHQSSCFVCRIIMDRRPLMGCGPVRGTP